MIGLPGCHPTVRAGAFRVIRYRSCAGCVCGSDVGRIECMAGLPISRPINEYLTEEQYIERTKEPRYVRG